MDGSIRYIKFSGDYDKFDEWKQKTNAISRYKGIFKYLTKEYETPKEEDEEDDSNLLNYEGKIKAGYFIITSLTDISFGVARKCNDSSHEAWKSLIEKYEVSDEKQEIRNEVTNRCNTCRINDTGQYPDIWFNELYNLNLKFNKIKRGYQKDEDDMKSHAFDVLP